MRKKRYNLPPIDLLGLCDGEYEIRHLFLLFMKQTNKIMSSCNINLTESI